MIAMAIANEYRMNVFQRTSKSKNHLHAKKGHKEPKISNQIQIKTTTKKIRYFLSTVR